VNSLFLLFLFLLLLRFFLRDFFFSFFAFFAFQSIAPLRLFALSTIVHIDDGVTAAYRRRTPEMSGAFKFFSET